MNRRNGPVLHGEQRRIVDRAGRSTTAAAVPPVPSRGRARSPSRSRSVARTRTRSPGRADMREPSHPVPRRRVTDDDDTNVGRAEPRGDLHERSTASTSGPVRRHPGSPSHSPAPVGSAPATSCRTDAASITAITSVASLRHDPTTSTTGSDPPVAPTDDHLDGSWPATPTSRPVPLEPSVPHVRPIAVEFVERVDDLRVSTSVLDERRAVTLVDLHREPLPVEVAGAASVPSSAKHRRAPRRPRSPPTRTAPTSANTANIVWRSSPAITSAPTNATTAPTSAVPAGRSSGDRCDGRADRVRSAPTGSRAGPGEPRDATDRRGTATRSRRLGGRSQRRGTDRSSGRPTNLDPARSDDQRIARLDPLGSTPDARGRVAQDVVRSARPGRDHRDRNASGQLRHGDRILRESTSTMA